MEQRRLAIAAKYEKEIAAARKLGDEGVAKKLEGQRDMELLRLTDDYVVFFSWIEAMSEDVAKNIHNALREQLDEMLRSGKLSIEEYAKAVETIEAQMSKKTNEKSFGQSFTSEGMDGMISKFQSLGKAMELKGASTGDAKMQQFGQGMQSGAQKAQGAMQVVDMIVTNIHNGVVATQELINEGVQKVFGTLDLFVSLSETEVKYPILQRGILTFWTASSKGLGELKGSDKFAAFSEFDKHAASGWSKLKSGDIAGATSETAQSYISIFTSLNKIHDKKFDKKIAASVKEVKKLQNAYSDLERAIDKSLGTDKYSYTSDQIKNIQAQQAEIAIQAQAERDKKKTDEDKVADLEREYVELGQKIEDLLDNIRDEVIGGTSNEIAQELGNAFFDAFAAGENYAEAWGSKVKDIVGDIVKRMLIDKLLDKQIGDAIDKYSKQWMDSAGNINTDKVISSSEDFYNELMGIGDGFQSAIEALTQDPFFMELLGPGNEAGKGLSEGIKSITEDTAQLLASYLNAIRGSVLLQELYMKNIDTNVAGIYQAMGGSPNITTTTTIPPEIIAAISEPMKLNNSLLASIDVNMSNVHSIAANALAQLVMIQANTYNMLTEIKRSNDSIESVISPGHPKGGNGIKVWA